MNGPLDLQNNPGEMLRWIDRLVDGELDGAEQRQVLLALEAQPDYWRRCALAFVESQTWRSELRGVASEPVGELATGTVSSSVSRSRRVIPQWAALAAGVVIAFTVGVAARHFWSGGEQLAGRKLDNAKFVAMNDPAIKTDGPKTPDVPDDVTSESNNSSAASPRETVQVSLPSDDGQEEQSVVVPVVEGDEQQLRSLLANQKPVLSAVALKALETSGHEVEQRRAFYPVKLQDGRQAVVPMDIVEVRYTGGWQ